MQPSNVNHAEVLSAGFNVFEGFHWHGHLHISSVLSDQDGSGHFISKVSPYKWPLMAYNRQTTHLEFPELIYKDIWLNQTLMMLEHNTF